MSLLGLAMLLCVGGTGCRSNATMDGKQAAIVPSTTRPSDAGQTPSGQNHERFDAARAIDEGPPPPPAPLVADFVGQTVRVQFRRDALGLVADAPTPPLNEGLPRRPVFLDGLLKHVAHDGAILEVESRAIWIPWSSVLLIESRPGDPG
jgi:hypothetical protein